MENVIRKSYILDESLVQGDLFKAFRGYKFIDSVIFNN